MRRTKIGKCYVNRRKNGRFKNFTSIGKSLSADRRRISFKSAKPGYGNQGDNYRYNYFGKVQKFFKMKGGFK